eukprot:m.17286 g.17286  ORF g.17286 m.17286 type:complete len:261 (+) comp3577_c0_seq1:30-812(+)
MIRNFATQAMRLQGRVALVTASTDGIGLAVARRLGMDGAHVVVSSRKQQNVDEAVESLRADGICVSGLVCHVGKAEDRTKLIEHTLGEHGKLDILVSNAAVNPVFGPAIKTPEDAWDKIFDINVKAAFLLTQEAFPHLKKSDYPSIVFISSIAGLVPFPALGPYSVSKTALLGMTKVLANEMGPFGIRVNAVAPGVIKTRFSEQLWGSDAVAKKALAAIPLGRFGETVDCAGLVSFLCSDDAAYITGETHVVAGGMQSRL